MKKLSRVISLIVLISVFIQFDINARQVSITNCPESSKINILYLAPILLAEDNKEQKNKLGIKDYDVTTYKFEQDSLLLDNVIEYWQTKSVSMVNEGGDCTFINESLSESTILETLPSSLKKFFYKVEDKFVIMFQYDCGEGCVRMGGEKLPVLIIDKEGDIHELMRL